MKTTVGLAERWSGRLRRLLFARCGHLAFVGSDGSANGVTCLGKRREFRLRHHRVTEATDSRTIAVVSSKGARAPRKGEGRT